MVLRQQPRIDRRLEPLQVRLPGSLEEFARQTVNMLQVHLPIAAWQLEILSDSFVEPERDVALDGVQVAVRGFVP